MSRPRGQYHPSGRVSWLIFSPMAAVCLSISAGIAWGLSYLYLRGMYLPVIFPGIPAVGLGMFVFLTVWMSSCRSVKTTKTLGIALAVVLYGGMYYGCLARDNGRRNLHRIDRFAAYFAYRMSTDGVLGGKGTNPQWRQAPIDYGRAFLNLLRSGCEFLIVLFFVTAGWGRAGRQPYCETCRQWMKSASVPFSKGMGPTFVELLERGDLYHVPMFLRNEATSRGEGNGSMKLHFCAHCSENNPRSPVYFTIEDAMPIPGVQRSIRQRLHDGLLKPEPLVDNIVLTSTETLALQVLFPELAAICASPSLRANAGVDDMTDLEAAGFDEVARVEPVPAPYAGQATTSWQLLVENSISTVFVLGGFAVVLGIPLLLFQVVKPMPDRLGGTIVVLMFAGLIILMVYLLWFIDFIPARYRQWVVRNTLEQRPDSWVNPNDPDAIYVEVIPRTNWARFHPSPTDVGMLKIDKQRKEVFFEGSNQRFRIPCFALCSCVVESFSDRSSETEHTPAMSRYVVVLAAIDQHGASWQTWLVQRQQHFRPSTNATRRAAAESLALSIIHALDPES